MKAQKNSTLLKMLLLPALAGAFLVSDAGAVGTRHFILNNLSSFQGGELEGVSISSLGEVAAGWTLSDLPITDASSAWTSAIAKDGSVLIGTGAGGRVYREKAGKVSIAAETGEMALSAMTKGFDGTIYAGSFPKAKLFKLTPDQLKGKMIKPWIELKDAEDIWDLAFDAKSNSLYAATGPNGKVFRINSTGKADVYFDSEEAHIVSVAVDSKGTVYAGSNGKALLYKITAPGRAVVMHDFDGADVKAIRVSPKGEVFAVTNKYSGGGGLRSSFPMGMGRMGSMGSSNRSSSGGGGGSGTLYRFGADGVAEKMLSESSAHFVSLQLDANGDAVVGTGKGGKVYTVNNNHVKRLLVETKERQVGAMNVVGTNRYIVTSDPVVFHRITGEGGADAIWTSKVLDAGLRAHFGMLDWRGKGALEFQTRTGNSKKPDKSWSPWSASISKPAKVTSKSARFLQLRAKWSRDPKAVLHEVEVSFITDNARALLTEITADKQSSKTGGSSVPESGKAPSKASDSMSVNWKVSNPDSDKLRYRIYYQGISDTKWFSLLTAETVHTGTSYTWKTEGIPEGHYRLRVDVTDELSNPPDKVTNHTITSRSVTIDNTAPVFTALSLKGSRLSGRLKDGIGPIARIEFRRVGGDQWFPLNPTDKVFDEATESFDVDLKAQLPAGPVLVVVRGYDRAGNIVSKTAKR